MKGGEGWSYGCRVSLGLAESSRGGRLLGAATHTCGCTWGCSVVQTEMVMMANGVFPIYYHGERNPPSPQDSKTQNLAHFSQKIQVLT